ncbi:MAG TPA: SIMPL domain-containing protein [Ktedonobacterales bacterium]|nr:SIMPL domain-containing protein [Ktedonobacterales bacterium]
MSTPHAPRTIAVTGYGKINIAPDEAHIQAGVQASATTARDVSAIANQAMNDILAALKERGVAEQSIQTSWFAIRPEYEHRDGTQHRIGHAATNTVAVTITALDTLGAILDAIIEAGGDHILINNISFAANASAMAQAEDRAQQAALADARRQAELIAQALGITLGAVLTVDAREVNAGGSSRPLRMPMMMAAGGRSTPIETGDLDVATNVEIVYEIATQAGG